MQTIYLDISNKGIIPTINAKQNDVGRKFCVLLFENGMPYNASENRVLFFLWYSGASGEGHYDTIFTKIGQVTEGRYAFVTDGNSVVVELATQMLTNAGSGQMCLTMKDTEGKTIGLWNIPYNVEEVPGYPSEETKPYYPLFENLEQQINNAVSVMPQSLTPSQQSQARANIDALQVPMAKEVTSEPFLYANWDAFSADGDLMVYKQTGKLDWMKEPEDFDFHLSFSLNGKPYYLKKSDCVLSGMSITGEGKRWDFQYRPNGMTRLTTITVANGINPVTLNEEDSFSVAHPATYEDYECELSKITTTERKLRVVTSVNGVEADENGNVELEVGGGSGNVYIGTEQPTDGTPYWLDTAKYYSVTNNLTETVSNNGNTEAREGGKYYAQLTAAEGYEISKVTVLMGGEDVTANVYADGVISIAAVTGDVVITAVAKELPQSGDIVTVEIPDVATEVLVDRIPFYGGTKAQSGYTSYKIEGVKTGDIITTVMENSASSILAYDGFHFGYTSANIQDGGFLDNYACKKYTFTAPKDIDVLFVGATTQNIQPGRITWTYTQP